MFAILFLEKLITKLHSEKKGGIRLNGKMSMINKNALLEYPIFLLRKNICIQK
jgi:hypothetical protein